MTSHRIHHATRRSIGGLIAAGLLIAAWGRLETCDHALAQGSEPPAPTAASATLDQASAAIVPWSGYWWPRREGALLAPLRRYDELTGADSAGWEARNHPAGDDVPGWFGYCHGWAASSVLEPEPTRAGWVEGPRSRIRLSVGDQKGLLAACHADDLANVHGDRFGDGLGSDEPEDLRPDVLMHLLDLYVRRNEVPLILDIAADEQVWNYPVHAYRLETRPTGPEDWVDAKLTLLRTDNGVAPDFVGTRVDAMTYRFRCRMRGSSIVMGTAEWIGPSVDDHPDFAWYPYLVRAENPEIDVDYVHAILGALAGDTPMGPRIDHPEATASAELEDDTNVDAVAEAVTDDLSTDDRTRAEDDAQPIAQELCALLLRRTASFEFDLSVDRFDGGRYAIGDPIELTASSARSGYLYVFRIDEAGNPALVFPQADIDGAIAARTPLTVRLPGGRPMSVDGPVGIQRWVGMVLDRRISFPGATHASLGPQRSHGNAHPDPTGTGKGLYVEFDWHPAQRRNTRRWLSIKPTPEAPDRDDARTSILSDGDDRHDDPPPELPSGSIEFAVDEVLIYVQPDR